MTLETLRYALDALRTEYPDSEIDFSLADGSDIGLNPMPAGNFVFVDVIPVDRNSINMDALSARISNEDKQHNQEIERQVMAVERTRLADVATLSDSEYARNMNMGQF
jgi:hypothetical protein